MNDEVQKEIDVTGIITACEAKLVCGNELRAWFCEIVDLRGMLSAERVPRWWWLCINAARNGGWEVHGWGFMSSAGLFGSGLDQDNAIALMQYSAFMDGAATFGPENPFEILEPVFEEFINIHKKLAGFEDEDSED